jgi:multiple sugar transport system ATP-binding protein
MGELKAEGIGKVFPDGTRALVGVSFSARAGRVLTLLGPSGCGKSTLLRIVAGLDSPTEGTLTLDGRRLDDVPPGARDVGFVFQNYALYPHLSVAGNMGLALRVRGVAKETIESRVRQTAALLGIERLLDRRPGQLSGGQQQRVALGRALVRRPSLYLLDEPLSNLDALLREDTRRELKALFSRVESIVLYVTHDQAEAMSLSDEVAVLRGGAIRQIASPLELYTRPADLFVATFVGSPRITLWSGRREGDWLLVPPEEGRSDDGVLRLRIPSRLSGGITLAAGIRPEDVEAATEALEGGWEARVELSEPLGARVLLTLDVKGRSLRTLVPPGGLPSRLFVRWPAERIHWFDAATEKRLEPPP